MSPTPTIAVDLDGTIAEWGSRTGQEGGDLGVGEWMDGALAGLSALRSAGIKIVVHSCRASWEAGGGTPAIAKFLRSGGFLPFVISSGMGDEQREVWRWISPVGEVSEDIAIMPWLTDVRTVGIWHGLGKPIAHMYVDDRSFPPFDGDWTKLLAAFGL